MNPNQNPNYVQNRKIRRSKTMAATQDLKDKADEISEVCGAEVAVVSFPADDVPPLFHGHPSLRAVLERFTGNNPVQDFNALNEAVARINVNELSGPELRALRIRLDQFGRDLPGPPA